MNPYKGLKTYQEEDSKYFWGRANELSSLFEQVNSRKNTILSGMSGSGKSSLINAGLIPKLKDNGYIPIRVTPNEAIVNSLMDIWKYLSNKMRQTIEDYSIKIIPHNGVTISYKDCGLLDKLNLFDYKDEFEFNVSFVFIIDQFEEIFQRKYNLKDIADFLSIYQGFCIGNFTLPLSQIRNYDLTCSFDLANHISDNSHKFLISVRQDYLFEIDRYSVRYPLFQQNRFHLAVLNEEQAYEIISSAKDNNGKAWFSESDATLILQNILQTKDFVLDDIPELEVDAMLLSLYLFQALEIKLKGKNENLPNPDVVISQFYTDRMNFENSQQLERKLISDTGLYRLSITYNDALNFISEDKLKSLAKDGIINLSQRGEALYVELHHDRLCKCASEHIALSEFKMKNSMRFSAFAYLSMKNRVLHENSYWFLSHGYMEHLSHAKWKSFIIDHLKQTHSSNMGDFSGLFVETSDAHSYSVIVKLSSKFGDGDKMTFDGISKFELKYVHGLLYSLSYKDEHSNNIPIYTGVSTYNFYYDDNKRVALIEFLDVYGKKQMVSDGYSSILFIYDDNNNPKLPSDTYYLNLPESFMTECSAHKDFAEFSKRALKYSVKHLEGNYGYKSVYDSYGCEIERVFCDKSGNECCLHEGFSRIKLEKTVNDDLLSISYFKSEMPVINNESVHKIVFSYASNGTGYSCKYLDCNGNPTKCKDGSYGNHVDIDFDEKLFTFYYLDSIYEKSPNSENILYQKNWFDSRYNIVKSQSFDIHHKLVSGFDMDINNHGLMLGSREYDSSIISNNKMFEMTYDEKCRLIKQTIQTCEFNESIYETDYDEIGNARCLCREYSYVEQPEVAISIINRGTQRKYKWSSDGLFVIINCGKDGSFIDGFICDKDNKPVDDPDYGASKLEFAQEGNKQVRIFKTQNETPVIKEYYKDELLVYVKVFIDGQWKIREQLNDTCFILWQMDELDRKAYGYICNKAGVATQFDEIDCDTIHCKYCGDYLIKLYKQNNTIIKQEVYMVDDNMVETLIKEYSFVNNQINLKSVKYFDETDSSYYSYYDESQTEKGNVPSELNGIHSYKQISQKDNEYDIFCVNYVDKDNVPVNCSMGWATQITKRKINEPTFEVNDILVQYLDAEGNPVNGTMDYGLYGAQLELKFLRQYVIGLKLYVTKSHNAKLILKGNYIPKKMRFFSRKKYLKLFNLFAESQHYGLKHNKMQIFRLADFVTKCNSEQIGIESDESFLITSSEVNGERFWEMVFLLNGVIVYQDIIHIPQTRATSTVIMLTQANPKKGYNLKNNDIILKFGDWNFFEYRDNDRYNMIERFEEIFNDRLKDGGVRDVVIARKFDNKWRCFCGEIKFEENQPSLGKIQDSQVVKDEIEYIKTIYNQANDIG